MTTPNLVDFVSQLQERGGGESKSAGSKGATLASAAPPSTTGKSQSAESKKQGHPGAPSSTPASSTPSIPSSSTPIPSSSPPIPSSSSPIPSSSIPGSELPKVESKGLSKYNLSSEDADETSLSGWKEDAGSEAHGYNGDFASALVKGLTKMASEKASIPEPSVEIPAGKPAESQGVFEQAMNNAMGGCAEPDRMMDSMLPTGDAGVRKVAVLSSHYCFFMHLVEDQMFRLHGRNMDTYDVFSAQGLVEEFGGCADFANAVHQPALVEKNELAMQLKLRGDVDILPATTTSDTQPFTVNPYCLQTSEETGKTLKLTYYQPGEINPEVLKSMVGVPKGEGETKKGAEREKGVEKDGEKAGDKEKSGETRGEKISTPPEEQAAKKVDESAKAPSGVTPKKGFRTIIMKALEVGSKEWQQSVSIIQHEQLLQMVRVSGYSWNTVQDLVATVVSHQEKFERFGASLQ